MLKKIVAKRSSDILIQTVIGCPLAVLTSRQQMLESTISQVVVPVSDINSLQEPRGVLLIRLLLAGLLLATATLKVLSPAESATMAVAYNIPPFLTAMVVQLELAIAVLLLFGCWPKRVLLAAAVIFALFGAFSTYRGFAGYESCGCFGAFKMNPWTTAALDGVMLLLAAWGAYKSPAEHHDKAGRRSYASGLYAVTGLLAAVGMTFIAPTPLVTATLSDSGGVAVLEPESWKGKSFPLTPYLSSQVSFNEGSWTMLLYHNGCELCEQAIPKYETLATVASSNRIVLIEVPPYGNEAMTKSDVIRTRLLDNRDWFVQTPVEIQVEGGVVVSVSQDLPAINATLPTTFSRGQQ